MAKYLAFLLLFFCGEQPYAQTFYPSSEVVELVSKDLNRFQNVRDFFISANEKEAYFTVQSPGQELSAIVCVTNGKWDQAALLPFCDGYSYLEPFLSRDSKRLYFASDRPKTEQDTLKSDFDIWYVERKDRKSVWSNPINLGSPVNSANDEFYPSLADNNNLYFTMDASSGLGKDDIYYCKWDGASYSNPILLSENINSEGYEFNSFISKNEDLLIFTKYNAKDGFGSGDLYVSRRNEKGEWATAENLGNKINSKYMEYCPFYHVPSNTLYFTSKRSSLSPRTFKTLEEFQAYISSTENGLSKIYKIQIKL